MTQLKTTFAGLSLRNPIIISSSSLTNSAEKNKKLELAGAGAIVLKSVFEEQIMMEAHHMATYGSPEGDDYLSTYVRSHALNEYISLIEQTKKLCTIPVIASINCFSNSEWTDFARTVETAGADALDIDKTLQPLQQIPVPAFPRHVSYDLMLFGSWRRKAVDVPGGQVPAPGKYGVAGFCFAPMYNFGYKFRAGVSLDGVYDASANIYTKDYATQLDGASEEEAFGTPPLRKQLSLGVSARGEWVMPYFTIGIGFGANILHGGGDLQSFYQILALKIDMTRDTFLHVGYNLKDFHEPNYLMLGIGYRFNNRRPRLHIGFPL